MGMIVVKDVNFLSLLVLWMDTYDGHNHLCDLHFVIVYILYDIFYMCFTSYLEWMLIKYVIDLTSKMTGKRPK